jgi:hypothetical protein
MLYWDLARAGLHAALLFVGAGILAAIAAARSRLARPGD